MLQTRENFIRSAILECTRDARLAFNEWDHETVLAASKTLLAVSAQMAKMRPAETFDGLDDMCLDLLSKDEESDDGGLKVTSDTPDPVIPPSGEVVSVQNCSPAYEEPDSDPEQPDLREPEPVTDQQSLVAALMA